MSYKYEFHAAVANDYNEAFVWYETQKESLGERFALFVKKKMDQSLRIPNIMVERLIRIIGKHKWRYFPTL